MSLIQASSLLSKMNMFVGLWTKTRHLLGLWGTLINMCALNRSAQTWTVLLESCLGPWRIQFSGPFTHPTGMLFFLWAPGKIRLYSTLHRLLQRNTTTNAYPRSVLIL